MDGYEMSVKALAANMGITISDLADQCGISRNHLKMVSAGKIRMTSDDLKAIARVTGYPCHLIIAKSKTMDE